MASAGKIYYVKGTFCRNARIESRSNADRGIGGQSTIHEGIAARVLEKGIISGRCGINQQIKADNALLRELKA